MSEFVDGATTPEVPAVPPTSDTPVVVPPAEPTTSAVDNWVGEGKKYKTPDDLANAYSAADQRLEELKLENERLASEKISSQAILDALEVQKAAVPETTPTQSRPVEEIVAEQLKLAKDSDTKAAKVAAATKMAEEAFGGKKELALAVGEYIGGDDGKKALINQLAITDPEGMLKLLGKEKVATNFTTDHNNSTGNTEVNVEGKLTWAVARQLQKDNPTKYHSAAFRKRMQNELL